MKKIIFCLLLSQMAFAIGPEEVYQNVGTFFHKNLPDTFTCEIKGDNLQKSMQLIPPDAIKDKKNLKIELLFHKKLGNKVILKGVVTAYEDRFSYIEKVFEFITPFIREKNYAAFAKKYDLYDARESGFKLKKKLTHDNYLDVFMKDGLIAQIKEYKNGKLLMNLNIFYKYFDRYFLPAEIKVFFYDEDKLKILKFELTNFNFNPNISEEEFLG